MKGGNAHVSTTNRAKLSEIYIPENTRIHRCKLLHQTNSSRVVLRSESGMEDNFLRVAGTLANTTLPAMEAILNGSGESKPASPMNIKQSVVKNTQQKRKIAPLRLF